MVQLNLEAKYFCTGTPGRRGDKCPSSVMGKFEFVTFEEIKNIHGRRPCLQEVENI
jgi:hypothetical protein